MPRHRRSERIRSDKRLRTNYVKLVTKQFMQAFHNVAMERMRYLSRIHRKIEEAKRKAIRERAEKLAEAIKKRQVTVYAVYQYDALRNANIEQSLINRYGVELDDLILTLAEYSKNGFSGIPPTEPNPDKIRAIGSFYYAPFNSEDIHSTACAIRLTPKTARVLEGMKADFYVIAVNTPEGLMSQVIPRSNPMYHLVEYLAKIMRRKGRREKHTRKRKGHYGVIQPDEPIHMVYTNWFEERYPIPLRYAINSKYDLKWFNAISVGLPERAFRLGDVNIIAIIGRKGKLTKVIGKRKDFVAVYERSKIVRGKF